jgi:TM2 domain-containing membrane protein YozV
MSKSRTTAFFLGFIPGMGHMYLGKMIRGILYPLAFLFTLGLGFMFSIVVAYGFGPLMFAAVIAFFIWIISMIDLIVTSSNYFHYPGTQEIPTANPSREALQIPGDSYSTKTIMLSLIPGLGHMHLGLMYRGLTFMIGFFGILTMIFFIAVLTGEGGFLVFLGALPIIWIYSLFDAIQLLHRRNRGEVLVDRSIMEELDEHRQQGRKSKMLATFLSIFPGAGHMYLGLQKRGLQLMVAFLFSIYILDVLHLSLFLFLIPILWFYSFFDALQQVSKHARGEAHDVPIVDWLINHQRWVGIALLALGGFYIMDQVALPILYEYFPEYRFNYLYQRYFQTTVVSVLLVAGGIFLLKGSKKNKKNGGELE